MRRMYLFSLIVTGFLFATLVFAAGGGGGGSVPTPGCDADTWTCSEWSSCSLSGTRTRTCTLTFDCGYVTTPKPSESETCTPPCTADTWECIEWGACTDAGKQFRECNIVYDCPTAETPQPILSQKCIPGPAPVGPVQNVPVQNVPTRNAVCVKDTWSCDAWSVCDPEGNQRRTCRRSFDCAAVDTPQPENIRRCKELQCGNKPTLRERIQCRLGLTPAGLTRELEIQYLPEECRALPAAKQPNCITRYQSFQPCWQIPVGERRFNCALNVLSLRTNVPAAVTACLSKKSQEEQTNCAKSVQQAAYDMIKFRFYDLEERAEDLAEAGKADLGVVADFVNLIETKKQEFNRATTKEQRRQIILDVRNAWSEFIQTVKSKSR